LDRGKINVYSSGWKSFGKQLLVWSIRIWEYDIEMHLIATGFE
jgi:hypothetical protein